MRIALCVTGQPRTWKRCYQTWIDAVSHLGEVDIFYHMWDFNTHPNMAASLLKTKLENVPITDEERFDLLTTLQPKAHLIEPAIQMSRPNVKNPISWWARSQFLGIKKCALLKRQYEIDNNFEYDMVVRIRTDLVLNHKIENINLNPETLYTCVNQHDPEYKTFRIGDIFYYSNSYTYDMASKFYDAFDFVDANDVVKNSTVFPPELAFYYYLKSVGLYNVSSPMDCKIARTAEYEALKGGLEKYETL